MSSLEQTSQFATDRYNRLLDLSLKITDDFNSARRLDIQQQRDLLFQISFISFTAFGFSIPLIGLSSGLKNPQIFLLGLLFLFASGVGTLFYSLFNIEGSLIASAKGFQKNINEIDTAITNQVFLMKNPDKFNEFVAKTEVFVDKLNKENSDDFKVKREKILYVWLTLLALGVVFVTCSLLPIKLSTNAGQLPNKECFGKQISCLRYDKN